MLFLGSCSSWICFVLRGSLFGLEFTNSWTGWLASSRELPLSASPALRSQAHATMLGFLLFYFA